MYANTVCKAYGYNYTTLSHYISVHIDVHMCVHAWWRLSVLVMEMCIIMYMRVCMHA